MGFWDRLLNKASKDRANAYDGERDGKAYRFISTISLIGIFVAAGLLVISLTGIIKFNRFVFGLIGTIFIICIACSTSLYWFKKLEDPKYKKVSLVFIILVGVCALLWVICLWMVIAIMKSGNAITVLKFIKATVIISMQCFVASFVAMGITKYKNSMIAFQIVAYLSYAFVDFYFTVMLACITIKNNSLNIASAAKFLVSKGMITALVLAIVYVLISNSVIKQVEKKRIRRMVDNEDARLEDAINRSKQAKETPEQKLEKINNLLEKGLITKEEYDQKRAEIMKEI